MRKIIDRETGEEISLATLIQTCHACPSQWSAKTAQGEDIYIRFRFDELRTDVTPAGGDTIEGEIMELEREYGSYIEFEKIEAHVAKAILAARRLMT